MSWLFFCCCAKNNERGFIVLQFQRGWGVYNGRRNTVTGRGEIISSTANINQRVNLKCSETVGAQTQSPSRVMLFFQQGSFSKDSTKSTTEWGPSFQVHRPTGDISHRSPHCSENKAIATGSKYRAWWTMVISVLMPVGYYFCFVFDTRVSRSPG